MLQHLTELNCINNNNTSEHPYEQEILQFDFLPEQLSFSEPQIYQSLESTPLYWIDTLEKLQELGKLLDVQHIFAIDLEV